MLGWMARGKKEEGKERGMERCLAAAGEIGSKNPGALSSLQKRCFFLLLFFVSYYLYDACVYLYLCLATNFMERSGCQVRIFRE